MVSRRHCHCRRGLIVGLCISTCCCRFVQPHSSQQPFTVTSENDCGIVLGSLLKTAACISNSLGLRLHTNHSSVGWKRFSSHSLSRPFSLDVSGILIWIFLNNHDELVWICFIAKKTKRTCFVKDPTAKLSLF